MEIDCKQYRTKEECDTRDANCNWVRNRGCIRRRGVLGGRRFRYDESGNAVRIQANEVHEPPTAQLQAITLQDPFEINYDPENDPVRPVLTQRTLFSGGYGITFIPAFPCANGQTFLNTLGKVFFDKDSADSEWQLSKRIEALEKGTTQKYFTYPKFQCEIRFKCPQNRTPLQRLTGPERDLYNFYNRNTNDRPPATLTQHVMEYSGDEISKYFQRHFSNSNLKRVEYLSILENLFYGIKRLNDHNLIHCDLKEQNIIISNKKRLRIIDFGLTLGTSDFYNPGVNTLIMVPYPYVAAPELGAFVKKQNNEAYLTYQEYINQFNKYMTNGSMWYQYFTQGQYEQQYNSMIQSVQSAGLTYLVSADAAYKQDPYTIGCIIMRLTAKFNVTISSAQDTPETVKLYKELVKGLLAPDPRHRLNINQAIKILKEILKEPHRDMFRITRDPQEMTEIFSAFGKHHTNYLKQVNADINYLTR